MELQGKRIIITGSASGMGAATVATYVKAGADVVAMDIADGAGKAIAEKANDLGSGGSAVYMHVDVADRKSVQGAFDVAVERLGGLDVLAHPAAIWRPANAGDVSVEDWDLMFAINVRGTMLTNQVAYHHMKKSGGGSIINFGSISGLRQEISAAAYSAAKGAVHSWTRTAAGTWGVDNVRVNAILPAIVTPMYDEALSRLNQEQMTGHFWQNLSTIAMGHAYGDPERDLGPVMVFFASDASRFISGQLIPVDGGQASVR
jgi:NAD(P)-dependent dehydrogenase (short-subunit alcohol dehydrogenase family)